MKTINIPFGGFYGSIHEQNIDIMLDNYFMDKEGTYTIDYNSFFNIDYDLIFNEYIKQYLNNLYEFINDEVLKIDIKFHNIKLDSPKFYNFETDIIICNIANNYHDKLLKHFKKDDNFLHWLNIAAESKSGYISFYNYDEALNNKDNILIEYIMKYICDELFTNDEYMSLYDMNYNYELLGNLDFFKLSDKIYLHDKESLNDFKILETFTNIENSFYFKICLDDVLLNSINHNFISTIDSCNNFFNGDYTFKYLTLLSEEV